MAANNKQHSRFSVWLIIVGLSTSVTHAAKNVTLDSVTSVVGDNTTLTCRPEIDADVIWSYHNTLSAKTDDIYSDGRILDSFRLRFDYKLNGNQRNIVITPTKASDAGLYSCTEDNGIGQIHTILLSVIGEITPECDCKKPTPQDETSTIGVLADDGNSTPSLVTQTVASDSAATCHSRDDIAAIAVLAVLTCLLIISTAVVVLLYVRRRRCDKEYRRGDAEENKQLVQSPGRTPIIYMKSSTRLSIH